jgi:UDP-glucose 4-epimerase
MKVVVTGGAGFIGANLCRALATDPAVSRVVALDDLSTGARSNLDGVDMDFVEGSILDEATLRQTCAGADAIVHLAARPSVPRSLADPVASHDVNATGTMRVLETARAVGGSPVVVASSSSVYGANPTLPKHESLATVPLSPYAASKLATEAYAVAYSHSFGLPVLPFRFFNVFGPLQPAGHAYAAVVPAFVSAALTGEPLVVHGDGKQTRDFTFVRTVTAVITAAVVRGVRTPEPVNLAYGTRTDLLTVIDIIERVIGRQVTVEHVAPRPGDVRHSQADNTRLAELFPNIAPVDLETGLRETIDWFASRSPQAVG